MSFLSWRIEISTDAMRQIRKLDRVPRTQVQAFIHELAGLEDPRVRGKALTGPLRGLWRYRVGDWRIICDIADERLAILVVEVGHRSSIYR